MSWMDFFIEVGGTLAFSVPIALAWCLHSFAMVAMQSKEIEFKRAALMASYAKQLGKTVDEVTGKEVGKDDSQGDDGSTD